MHAIAPVPTDRQVEAMRLIRPEAAPSALERFLEHLKADPRLAQYAIGAVMGRNDAYRAAVLVLPSPGRTVTYCFSERRMTAPLVRDLTTWALEATQADLADLAQTLLPPHAAAMLEGVQDAGLMHLADLHHMQCTVHRPKASATLPQGVCTKPACDEVLAELLPKTYQGTLDCPALRGLRRSIDIIAGHRAGGQVDPDLWLAVFDDTQAVGCVLITLGPECTADLAYIGLIPTARGCALAERLMAQMLNRLADRQIRTIRLAVDSGNTPALALYRRLGFRRIGMQRAAIRSLREVQAAPTNNTSSTSH
ncbi:MAG: GNAT family N-acetyltransferase [Phycisphaerales bacterium]|nr:GNAT family N-acetyltransferase [Phycisphaerales bacterium]